MSTTPTAGATDQVSGLLALLGFRFAPRLRDLRDRRLCAFRGQAVPEMLAGVLAAGLVAPGIVGERRASWRVAQGDADLTGKTSLANLFTYRARPDLPMIQLSNSSTVTFVGVLALAASAEAKSDRQREFAAWISSHDQDVFGLGMVGFDLSELPWSSALFDDDRTFVLDVIETAKAGMAWDSLGYAPSEAWLQPILDQFRTLVEAFSVKDMIQDDARVWSYGGKPERSIVCPIHNIYQHSIGCVLCHDQHGLHPVLH